MHLGQKVKGYFVPFINPVFILLSIFACHISNISAEITIVPVMIGGENELDACASQGNVAGLKTGLLSVRAGPGVWYRLIDRLKEGQQVFICDRSDNNHWYGIVYSSNSTENDCGVSSPIKPAQPYKGKCKSGWVNERWIQLLAG